VSSFRQGIEQRYRHCDVSRALTRDAETRMICAGYLVRALRSEHLFYGAMCEVGVHDLTTQPQPAAVVARRPMLSSIGGKRRPSSAGPEAGGRDMNARLQCWWMATNCVAARCIETSVPRGCRSARRTDRTGMSDWLARAGRSKGFSRCARPALRRVK